jgi:predicted O-methyltransferase YrrM
VGDARRRVRGDSRSGRSLSIRAQAGIAKARGRALLELAGLPFLYASLKVARLYRPSFHQTSRHIYRAADRMGVYPVIDHYHDPPVRLRSPRRTRTLPGIDLRADAQLELLRLLRFGDELHAIPRTVPAGVAPYFDNPAFAPGDSQIYYSLLRQLKPSRVIEVGSGQSTRFAALALSRNAAEGRPGQLVAIEPYESPELEELDATVVRTPVELLGPDFFSELDEGDVLFIDSSHVTHPGGDVTYLLLEVVPALRPGVLVHVHDVFTPRDYPEEWSRRRWFWTEQYVVEALLSHSTQLEIVLAVNFLENDHGSEFREACPVAPSATSTPSGSIWLRTLG